MIQVLEQHSSGWTYAKNLSLSSSANAGWVPSWIVQSVPTAAAEAAAQPKQKAVETQQKPQPAPAHVAQAVETQQKPQPAQAQVAQAAPAVQPAPAAQQAEPAQTQPSPVAAETRNVMKANAAFAATSASQLTISVADLVEIVDRHASGWTYGRKVSEAGADAGAGLEGWFPDWVVCPQK